MFVYNYIIYVKFNLGEKIMMICKRISKILVLIGALNWGLVGLCNFDLVAFLFGPMTSLSRAVYILVGLSAICLICCHHMGKKEDGKQMKM